MFKKKLEKICFFRPLKLMWPLNNTPPLAINTCLRDALEYSERKRAHSDSNSLSGLSTILPFLFCEQNRNRRSCFGIRRDAGSGRCKTWRLREDYFWALWRHRKRRRACRALSRGNFRCRIARGWIPRDSTVTRVLSVITIKDVLSRESHPKVKFRS